MSESVEMYLVMTALERKGNSPVPLSLLAEKLSISPVSANEMCHKMSERGLVAYQPYKGITLTPQGEAMAQRVLRRRLVWEEFLINCLSVEPEEANDIACQLEHVTSDKFIESLSAFVERVTAKPSIHAHINGQALTTLAVGQQGYVETIATDDSVVRDFLFAQGVQPGSMAHVVAIGGDKTFLLHISGKYLSLGQGIAEQIKVVVANQAQ